MKPLLLHKWWIIRQLLYSRYRCWPNIFVDIKLLSASLGGSSTCAGSHDSAAAVNNTTQHDSTRDCLGFLRALASPLENWFWANSMQKTGLPNRSLSCGTYFHLNCLLIKTFSVFIFCTPLIYQPMLNILLFLRKS